MRHNKREVVYNANLVVSSHSAKLLRKSNFNSEEKNPSNEPPSHVALMHSDTHRADLD